MYKGVKVFYIILAFIIISVSVTGCYDRREVDEMAYVMAIGLDRGTNNLINLTVQIAVPLAMGGGGGGGGGGDGGGGESKSVDTITVQTPSLLAGLNLINNSVSKQINISHAKLIVFSEDLARQGLHNYLHALARNREFRPHTYVAVARGSAEDYLKSIKPKLEANPAKFYELTYSASYTGFNPIILFHDFYSQVESLDVQPVATLAAVGKFESSKQFNNQNSTAKDKGRATPFEGDYLAGDIPKAGGVTGERMGMAVFNGDKMVGAMDGEDVGYYLMSSGRFSYDFMTFPDPFSKGSYIVLNLKQSRIPQRRVDIVNGRPRVSLKVTLEADIASIQSGIDYESDTGTIENSAAAFIKDGITRFLNKTSKDLKSDVCGFGREVKGKFATWKEWEGYNWLDKYKDSVFDVSVDLKIRRPGLIIRTVPSRYSSGGGGK